jgi:ABC-2 type transport system ATP-binding protein
MSAPLLIAEDLSRRYGANLAVDGVSFTIRRGEVLGFLGPNGAGKSTTMQMLTGNLAPTTGSISINGMDLLESPKQAKAAIGYLPEQPPLYRDLTVDEFLTFCARLNRVARREVAEARQRAKERCGLQEVGSRLIGNLSKGYQQRVGIAQAIIHNPSVVILDEPTVGLDPIQIREIRQLIRELGNDHSVILSTHILPEVQATCDRVQIIHQGKLIMSDSIEGLTRRMLTSSLLVQLRLPPAEYLIATIAGITEIQALGEGRFRLHHPPEINPAETIATLAVEQGWGLLELTPERLSLEEVFVNITQSESDPSSVEEAR